MMIVEGTVYNVYYHYSYKTSWSEAKEKDGWVVFVLVIVEVSTKLFRTLTDLIEL